MSVQRVSESAATSAISDVSSTRDLLCWGEEAFPDAIHDSVSYRPKIEAVQSMSVKRTSQRCVSKYRQECLDEGEQNEYEYGQDCCRPGHGAGGNWQIA